jgi:hypothetical protein
VNLSKILSIFAVGFGIRIFISHFFDVNVFYDYIHPLSLGYYSFMASFVVFINELFSFYNISLFSVVGSGFIRYLVSIAQFFSSFFALFMNSFNFIKAQAPHFKFEYLKLSFLRSLFKSSSNSDLLGSQVKKEDFLTLGEDIMH